MLDIQVVQRTVGGLGTRAVQCVAEPEQDNQAELCNQAELGTLAGLGNQAELGNRADQRNQLVVLCKGEVHLHK